MKGMAVLVGCEESGTVRDAFSKKDVVSRVLSCDLGPTRSEGPHYQGDIFDVIDYPWDIGIFHPPCTHTAVSGARHFREKWNDGRQPAGVSFFMNMWRRASHIHGICFEQPVSIMSSLFRKPDQVIQPWMWGDYETKATCLWLRGLPLLVPKYKSSEECREALGLPAGEKPSDRIHKMPPGPDRARARSVTYAGIAAAMADQWAGALISSAGTGPAL